jgi:membrane protein required for colicin V production
MQPYDILMLIVLAAAVAWGAWKGLAWQIASLSSIALSYFVALRFRGQLAGVISAAPPWNIFLSMLILFLGTGLIVWIGFNFISELIEKVKLKEFDRQLGALFGAGKGVLLCVLITLFSVALLSDAQRQAICNSRSGYYIALLLDRADMVIPAELHQVLDPYLDKFDQSVPHQHVEGGERPKLPAALSFGQPSESPLNNPPRPPSFSATPPGFTPLTPAEPRSARRIEAQPARPQGSFRQ